MRAFAVSRWVRTSLALFLLFLGPAVAIAQISTATVVGTVYDPSGNVVPGATINIVNESTNEVRTSITEANGQFVVPYLRVGTYSVTVDAQGFTKFVRTGITLNVQARVEVDARLQVGAVTQTVNVRANSSLLETQSASMGTVVNSSQVSMLPLNGRRYDQLALLAGGVHEAPGFASRAEGTFSVAGNSSTQNNFVLDGADNNSYTTNLQDQSTQAVQPAVDSLAEFKLQVRDYDVEYGRSAGAVINATLKSGTNQYHGDLYEFVRNDKFDATEFFLNSAGQSKAAFRQNQFGGTIGGPILKDRLFFFGNWEGTRIRQGTTEVVSVPTPMMRNGNFTELNPEPQSPSIVPLAQFAGCINGGVVSPNCIDPVAAGIFALYPQPNANLSQNGVAGGFVGNNFVAAPSFLRDSDQAALRIDDRIGEKDTLFAHYIMFNLRQSRPGPFTATNVIADGTFDSTYGLNDDMGQSATIAWTHIFSPRMFNDAHASFNRAASHSKPYPLGMNVASKFGLNGIPDFGPSISGGLPEFDISGFAQMGSPRWLPQNQFAQIWQFKDVLTFIKGSHTLKGGVEWRRDADNFLDLSANRGFFSFSGQYTGQGITDFLLGLPNSDQLTSLDIAHVYRNGFNWFVEDDWRASSRLTVNYGVRYEYSSPLYERQNHVTNFDPNLRSGQGGLFTIPADASGTFERTTVHPTRDGFAPRAGFAYKISDRLVMRGGAGVYFAGYYRYGSESQLALNPPFLTDHAQNASQTEAPAIFLQNGFPSNFLAPVDINDLDAVSQLQLRTIDSHLRPSQIYEYSYGFQYSLNPNLMLDVSYVGNVSRHLWDLTNVNQSNLVTFGQPPVMPFPDFRQNRNLPPSQTFPTFIEWLDSGSNSDYNSLQVVLDKRMSNGLNFHFAYTWSKAMSQVSDFEAGLRGEQDRYRRNLEWGLWDNDAPHRFVASFIYEIPAVKTEGFAGQLLNHWQLNGITTYASGQPLTIGIPFDTSGTGSGNRPNCVAAPNVNQTIDHWLDPNAYAMPATYYFGNCSPTPGPRAPGISTWDMSLFKDIPITESKHFEFRAEAFNIWNKPQFGRPDTNIGDSSFGQISSTVLNPRQIQFALKFYF
jgi:Carboxypeptidase regulatory-like domain